MKNQSIIKFAKLVFGLFFLLGNICFFGYLISKNEDFAVGGYILLIYGTIINLLLVIGLAVYGFADKSKFNDCATSIGIICINIPLAILYTIVAFSFF